MKIVYTAIFGRHDTLKEPTVVTPGWRYLCFTDQPLESQTWEIVPTPLWQEDRIRTARRCKILFWEYLPACLSLWVDASFLINCNLERWAGVHVSPMTCVAHPFRTCVYEEAKACLRNKRGNKAEIEKQVKVYRELGVPARGGVIQSGVLLREDTPAVRALCELWWESVARLSTRDQLGFAYAAHAAPIFNLLRWDYRTAQDLIYKGHLKKST